jgi:hypothetical protein
VGSCLADTVLPMRVALITGCYGAYDPVRPLPEWHGFDDAVCVTDTASGIGGGWRVHVEPRDEHPRLAAKRPKMLPWLFTDCDAAVWLDASFEILSPGFSEFVRQHLERDDFVVWQHPEGRVCVTEEGPVCWDWPKYRGYDIRGQVRHYLAEGFPRRWGLFAGGTVGYRFTPEAKRLGAAWYGEQERWSIQDQISLPYLLWRSGRPFGVWRANEYDNPYVRVRWDERPDPEK